MDYPIKRALEKLDQEIKKDKEQTERHKQQLIKEVLSYNKDEMFTPIPKKKKSFFRKVLLTLGYGKKR